EGEEGVGKQAQEYQKRRDVLVDALRRIGWEAERPLAGMFVWARYPEEWRNKMGSIDFSMKLLEEAEVAVSPGRGFGEVGEGHLRLALIENEHRLRQAVRQIGHCLTAEKAVTCPSGAAGPLFARIGPRTMRSLLAGPAWPGEES